MLKTKDVITLTDNNLYKEALNNAVASVELEGYEVTDTQKEFCLDFISGKINKEDFINLILEGCRV